MTAENPSPSTESSSNESLNSSRGESKPLRTRLNVPIEGEDEYRYRADYGAWFDRLKKRLLRRR